MTYCRGWSSFQRRPMLPADGLHMHAPPLHARPVLHTAPCNSLHIHTCRHGRCAGERTLMLHHSRPRHRRRQRCSHELQPQAQPVAGPHARQAHPLHGWGWGGAEQ